MRSLLAAISLLVLSACALPQQRSRTFTPYAPLEAYITSTASGGPLFHVNRPAYVAMFYIAPGQGASMLYPGFGSGSLSGRVFAGTHFARGRIHNGWQYMPTRMSFGGPRYYFLIASDRPLNIDQFGAFGDGLSSRLGAHFASFSGFSTMERIAQLALPSLADDGSWTTDFYVDWPSVLYAEPGPRRVLVSCNGYAMYVAAGYVNVVRSVMCDPDGTDPNDRPAPGEGEGEEGDRPVVRPKGRAPLPAQPETPPTDESGRITQAERRAIRERLTSSSQLAGPEARQAMAAPRDEYGYIRQRERPSYGSASSSAGYGAGAGSSAASSSRPETRGSASADSPSRGSTAATSRPASPSSGGSAAAPAPRSSDSGGSASSSGSQGRSRAKVD